MSLDTFATADDSVSNSCNNKVSSDKCETENPKSQSKVFWQDTDTRFYGEDTPNDFPIIAVNELLAARIEIVEDEEWAKEVAQFWNISESRNITELVRITFNDLRTWHWPLRPWDKDPTKTRQHIVEKYVPQVIRWEAILEGEDPKEAVSEWENRHEDNSVDFAEIMDETDMSDEDRKWFNKNADWMPLLKRKVEKNDDVDINVAEDDSWMDEEW